MTQQLLLICYSPVTRVMDVAALYRNRLPGTRVNHAAYFRTMS